MNVHELISVLEKFPADMEVIIDGSMPYHKVITLKSVDYVKEFTDSEGEKYVLLQSQHSDGPSEN